jgi:inosine-uridine nucleoside N-ribohydrolase
MTSIWIDTDNALGAERGDIDDGLALAALLCVARRGQISIAGISVVDGNTDATTAARCTRALVEMAEMDVPVIEAKQAAAAIATLPPRTSLLSLGPLTNIAAALRLNPRCSQHLELRMVGAVQRGWRHPLLMLSDLNQRTDRAAAHSARGAKWHALRIMPLDVIRALRIDRTALDRMAESGHLGNYLRTHSERWLARAAWRYPQLRSFPAWDLVAALDALDLLSGVQFDAATRMLTAFDALQALATFHSLLVAGPSYTRAPLVRSST